ncbi:MAG TPA: hypothetical protein VGH38_30845, partial [Bryobacteraceae bacterium]
LTTDFQSLTSFRRQSSAFAKRLKQSRRPLVLTVNGKPELADAGEGIRQGLEQAKQGKARDAEEFFAEFEAAHGISG